MAGTVGSGSGQGGTTYVHEEKDEFKERIGTNDPFKVKRGLRWRHSSSETVRTGDDVVGPESPERRGVGLKANCGVRTRLYCTSVQIRGMTHVRTSSPVTRDVEYPKLTYVLPSPPRRS